MAENFHGQQLPAPVSHCLVRVATRKLPATQLMRESIWQCPLVIALVFLPALGLSALASGNAEVDTSCMSHPDLPELIVTLAVAVLLFGPRRPQF